ncbi:Rne/Rng family ribonuclease [Anaerobacillus alkaliphilus]|uniref:Ribonuclease G n=1 Tax=Anaerobacillus alkaliphilus TaxID=1548597 RepID=A0A4Q0VPI7_9BACI|nr:Rne/Rng family ribonuclease [Anaerobacillus alkaliphilus]RXI98392.1 Rne/Rng family ribonuclease [Anaerobacillus alkaliphilus]
MKTFIFNMLTNERRLAILENKKVVELLIERPEINKIIGNVYKGKVVNVLPGMQAAFVDIGLDKNGFLYRDELVSFQQSSEDEEVKKHRSISQYITVGQEILVQVTKEGFGKKGPRLSEVVSFPGKYIVYMPNAGYIGVSKRMKNEETREEWRKIGADLCKDDEGMIIRTATEELTKEQVAQDLFFLRKLWEEVWREGKNLKPPALIHEDNSIIEKVVRDINFDEVDQIIIDTMKDYLLLKDMFSPYPELLEKLHFYQQKESIFAHYQIESELEKAMRRQVWLKNGAYLVIDQTEALTVFDVNTGKFTGKLDLQDTIVKTNLEAAKEIARQLRLRDIGGIIIIDFIDMKHDKDRETIMTAFKDVLRNDRTKTNILGFTGLGLLEMTRKKVRQNLQDSVSTTCPTCLGKGKVLSDEAVAYKVERALWEYKGMDSEALLVEVPPSVVSIIKGEQEKHLTQLEEVLNYRIFLKPNPWVAPNDFAVRFIGTVEEAELRM